MKLSWLGRIPQNFARFHYQAHAFITMKLRRKQSETPEKDRKRKHESRHSEERHQEKSMSKEKKCKSDCKESEHRR
uniref:Uncharacterized protein n=1 Tax=Romanomermis culicivorax TaxID=13658 RepID=A0A915KKX0_ROMCU